MHATDQSGGEVSLEPESWVDQYGDGLYAYAVSRLRDRAVAEDAVQETFLAAWKGRSRFTGQGSERGWLYGILKNKIADHLRRMGRETSLADLEFLADEQDTFFQASGWAKQSWASDQKPQPWIEPDQDQSLEKEEFWDVLRECTRKLPRRVAQVFMMREMENLGTSEICDICRISANHLWVMLHRARLALRRCLEVNWFKAGAKQGRTES